MRRYAIAGALSLIGTLTSGVAGQGVATPTTDRMPQVQLLPPTTGVPGSQSSLGANTIPPASSAMAPATLPAPSEAKTPSATMGRFATPLISQKSGEGCGAGCSCQHCPPSNQLGTHSNWQRQSAEAPSGRITSTYSPTHSPLGPQSPSAQPASYLAPSGAPSSLPPSGQYGLSRTPVGMPVPETGVPTAIPRSSGYPAPTHPAGQPSAYADGQPNAYAGTQPGVSLAGPYTQPYNAASPYGAQQASYQAPNYDWRPTPIDPASLNAKNLPEQPSWWRRVILRQKTVTPAGEDYYSTATVRSAYVPGSDPANAPARYAPSAAFEASEPRATSPKRPFAWWPFGN